MDKEWFEMQGEIRRRYAERAWVPLKISRHVKQGEYGFVGWTDEYEGVRTLAVHLDKREQGENITWGSMMQDPMPYAEGEWYKPADIYEGDERKALGVSLVLPQSWSGVKKYEWHLNTDLVLALGLLREGDVWVCPDEAFAEVVKLERDEEDNPNAIFMKPDFLKDYLAARRMALRITSFRNRDEIVENADFMKWSPAIEEEKYGGTFSGRLIDIHEGGDFFGAKTAVFHMSRNDLDEEADMPAMGPENNDNVDVDNWEKEGSGRKLVRINAEFRRNEWVEPGKNSPRIRWDNVPSNTSFSVDASGEKVSADDLNNEDIGKWLWFSPEVISRVLSYRGASLSWYTRDTASIDLVNGYPVHFGINEKGLINTYAYDIAKLPEWQRAVWAGFNIIPDAGVSKELLMSQVHAKPAQTQSPEEFLEVGFQRLNYAFNKKWCQPLFIQHNLHEELFAKIHRFRATDETNLLALAKDLTRLIADSINKKGLVSILSLPKGEQRGSLKLLEEVIATCISLDLAKNIMAPLFGANDLRLGDAHLPSKDIQKAFKTIGIDSDLTFIKQGQQMIHIIVSVLFALEEAILNGKNKLVKRI